MLRPWPTSDGPSATSGRSGRFRTVWTVLILGRPLGSIRTVRSTRRTVVLVDQDGVRTVNQDGFRTVFLSGGGGFLGGPGGWPAWQPRWSRLRATSADLARLSYGLAATSGRFRTVQGGLDGLGPRGLGGTEVHERLPRSTSADFTRPQDAQDGLGRSAAAAGCVEYARGRLWPTSRWT